MLLFPNAGKGSERMTAASFAEEEEEEEDIESQVPVSLREGTNADILVVEDVEEEDEEDESSTSKDLPPKPTELGQLRTEPPNFDTGSPTIVLQTEIGMQVPLNEVEDDEENEEEEEVEAGQQVEDENGEEEDKFDENDQFLSPKKSDSYGKNPEPPANNTHIQSVPSRPRKLVRKQTPIALDLPEDIKGT